MTILTLSPDQLDDIRQKPGALLLAHAGTLNKKVSKALDSVANGAGLTVASLELTPVAADSLGVEESGVTLLAFEDGSEIGRIFRPKAKEIYDYAAYFRGEGPLPDDRRSDEKPKIGAQAGSVTKPMLITEKNFKKSVLKSKAPVLVDMWAEWCGPCRTIAPVIEQLAAEFEGQARVAKLNVDENPAIARKYRVQSIPTLLIFKQGKEVERIVGVQPAQAIRERLAAWT